MNWFQRICQRFGRPRVPNESFWDALQEICDIYFEEERTHYWSLPEERQFGHVYESFLVIDQWLDTAHKVGWVSSRPESD